MQTTQDFAGSTDMWSTSAGGHLMKVVNLTGFTVSATKCPEEYLQTRTMRVVGNVGYFITRNYVIYAVSGVVRVIK